MANIYSLFLFILVERTSSNSAVRNKFIVTDSDLRVRKGGERGRGSTLGAEQQRWAHSEHSSKFWPWGGRVPQDLS